VAGTSCVLPGSTLEFQIFPALMSIQDISQAKPKKIADHELNIQGPVKDFTVMQDLEKGCISVWGESQNGFFRYHITSHKENPGWCLHKEKEPKAGLHFNPQVPVGYEIKPFKGEVLSLGVFKKQDWALVQRRLDLAEIFPFWMQLGQSIPYIANLENSQGTLSLLQECKKALLSTPPDKILMPFAHLFLAGFQGMLTPRLIDDQHQGFSLPPVTLQNMSPLLILTEGAKLIRSLFLNQNESKIEILTNLPPQFHSGRLINVKNNLGYFDIEWTKKSIRRMIVYTEQRGEWGLIFQKPFKRFRIRCNKKDKGSVIQIGETPLLLEANQEYFFDQFEK
jgi:hypothetical protein